MKLRKLYAPSRYLNAYGDCARRGCHHSIAYHMPFVGCIKCDCEEYQ